MGKDLTRIAQILLPFDKRMLAMKKRRMHFQTVPVAVVKKIAMLEGETTMANSSGAEREFAKETVKKTEPYSVYPLLTNNKKEQGVAVPIGNGLLLHSMHKQ
jgi:hypothetical protein